MSLRPGWMGTKMSNPSAGPSKNVAKPPTLALPATTEYRA
jgi:hypothetical protein